MISSYNQDGLIESATASRKGRRDTLEDTDYTGFMSGNQKYYSFGIFDGHGGTFTAEALKGILLKHRGKEYFVNDTSINEKFVLVDTVILEDMEKTKINDGSTACTLFIKRFDNTSFFSSVPFGFDFICCNVGDSRCVLFHDGKIIPMSRDHKPDSEKTRLSKYNVKNNRIYLKHDYSLAMSRAFGDPDFKNQPGIDRKKQPVIVDPEITRYKIESEFTSVWVVIACDGLWDVMDETKVFEYINKNYKNNIKELAEQLVNTAIDDLKSNDNVTCTLIRLK